MSDWLWDKISVKEQMLANQAEIVAAAALPVFKVGDRVRIKYGARQGELGTIAVIVCCATDPFPIKVRMDGDRSEPVGNRAELLEKANV